MAGENEIKKAEIGLAVTDETFASYQKLTSVLATVFDQLVKIQGSARNINLGGVAFNDPDKAGFTRQLAGLQKDLQSLLSSIRNGSPNAQINSAIVSNQRTNTQYADNRVPLELLNAQNSAAERRLMLAKDEEVSAEAARTHAVEQIGLTREIQQVTERLAQTQERLRDAIVAQDRASQAQETREIRNSRDRLDQLKQELDLRERGARVRLGNTLDAGNDPTDINAQLAAIAVGKAELNDAQRQVASTMAKATRQADSTLRAQQAPVNAAHTTALKEDRVRDVEAQQDIASIGPSKDAFDKATAQRMNDLDAAWDRANREYVIRAKRNERKLISDWTQAIAINDRVDADTEQTLAGIGPSKTAFEKATHQRMVDLDAAWDRANREYVVRAKLNERKLISDWSKAIVANDQMDALAEQATAGIGPSKEAFEKATHKRMTDLDAAWDAANREYTIRQKRQDRTFESQLRQAQVYDKQRTDRLNNEAQQQSGTSTNDATTRERRYNQTFGDGGASIAATQTALTANYFVTQGIAQAFTSAIQFTVQYEEALAHLHTIAGATQGQMAELRETIEGVSNATRYSATDLTKAAAALSETDVTVSQMKVALQGVSDLATATGEDFNKTVDTVTGALGSFKLSATDTVQISNMIAQAVNSSRLTMDKLKTSIETAGETASEAGVSFKEMLAANVAITNTGTASGATLGGGLRQLLIDLEKPSENFKTILAQVGLTEDDINVKTQGLYGAMKNLHDAGFTAADAMQSFDARSSSAFTALSGNLREMALFEDSLNDTDAASAATRDQMETLGAQFDRFKNQTSLLVGEGFTPLLYGFKELIKLVSDAESGMSGATGVVETLGTVLGGTALAAGSKYVGSLAGGLAGLATGGFEAAAGAAAAGGQIGLIIGAVAAAAAGVAYLIHTLSDSGKAFDDQKTAVNHAKDALKENEQGMDSIGRQIETLTTKMVALNEHPELLRREIDDVSKTFEKYGEQLDKSAIGKTEDLIGALKRLQGQMSQRYELNTTVLATQLDLMAEQAKRKILQSGSDFTSGTAAGPRDLVKGAQDYSYMPGLTGDTIAIAGGITKLPSGAQSTGALPAEGVSMSNLDQLVKYLAELTDPQKAAAVRAGFTQALGANAVPTNADEVAKALDTLQGANGGLNAARVAALQRADDPKATSEQKATAAGVDQLLDNYQAALKTSREALETYKTVFSDKAKVQTTIDQLAYDKGAGPTARANAVNQVLQNAERVLTSGSRANRSLDDIWAAQVSAESNGQQFDKDGKPLRSNKGAVGVAQVTESTGPEAASDAGVDWDRDKWLNDPAYNEKIGKAYMAKLLRQYGGNNTLALSAYNWGQGNVNDLLGDYGDFRDPSSTATESGFVAQLPKETRDYLSKIGGGSSAGALGQYQLLQNNRSMAQAASQTAQLVQQLEEARKQAQDANNPQEEASVTKLLDEAKTRLAEFERKYNSTREAASPALRKVSAAEQRSLEAQLGVANKQMNSSTDIDEIQSRGNDAKSLINSKYDDQIALLQKVSPKIGNDYSADVVAQIQKLEEERAAKIQAEDEAIKHHISTVSDALDKAKLQDRMRADQRDFDVFLANLKSAEKTRVLDNSLAVRNNATATRDDAAQASYMNDSRYSAQFSSVQRQALTFKTANDNDIQNQANLAQNAQNAIRIATDLAQATVKRASYSSRIDPLQTQSDTLDGKTDEDSLKQKAIIDKELGELLEKRKSLDTEITTIEGDQKTNAQDRLELEEKINAKKATPMGLSDGILAANENYVKMHDETATALDGYNNMISTTQGNLASFFDTILTGSSKAGDAMKAFAVSFLKSILSIMEQQAALAVVKSLFGLISSASGTATASPAVATGGFDAVSTGTAVAVRGGQVSRSGTITSDSTLRLAGGGTVPGGVGTRDSVHALLEPGEIVMNQSAVDSVGADYLNGLNASGNKVVSQSTPTSSSKRDKETGHVNVWVVAPDQKPSLGPKDVLATISDDVMRGGTTKQLIKQVALGQV